MSFLPTSVTVFIGFLHGETTSEYEDSGEHVLSALSSFLYESLCQQYETFLSKQRSRLSGCTECDIGRDLDVVNFLINVFPSVLHRGPIVEAVAQLSEGSGDIVEQWLRSYRSSELDPLRSSRAPRFGILSQSQVPGLVFPLLEHGCTLPNEIDAQDVAVKFNTIKNAMMDDLMAYLKRLSIGETNPNSPTPESLKHTPPGAEVVSGGLNQQDCTTQDIEHSEWFLAWNEEFRGSALENLELKLSLNIQALQTERKDKINMSRIIPIVQSSGTGKSRLAEQYITGGGRANSRYVKENFGVFLGLKNGQGFPPYDDYVYKYFKNLLRLEHRGWDVPDDPNDLSDLDKDDETEYRLRSGDAVYTVDEERSVYTAEWRYKRASGASVPKGWAAAGRLRVACFIAGFFNTMVSYMETKGYDAVRNWRIDLLHTDIANPGPARNQFWYDVIKDTLLILKASNSQQTWWKDNKTRTNAVIKLVLMSILEPGMSAFFTHPVTKECLSQTRKTDLPFLFIIDEAAYLYQTNYMHSFMWVLDEPVVAILRKLGQYSNQATKFFVLMLGTHSQISHFAPDYIYPSERVFSRKRSLPSVFLSLDWDSGVNLPERSIPFDQSACIANLVQWGRPIWLSFYNALVRDKTFKTSVQNDAYILKKAVDFAVGKLRDPDRSKRPALTVAEESSLTVFALLAIRLHLDLDFAAPSRASRLVTSRLRWLVDVDSHRKYIVTTYGSEPIIAEAAAYLLNSSADEGDFISRRTAHLWISPLEELEEQLLHGYVNKGAHGELTARLLLIMAKDQVTRESWWKDEAFLSHVSKLEGTILNQHSFATPGTGYYFKEAELYYRRPLDGYAFFHRAVKVKEFLKGFLSSVVFSQLATCFGKTKKWKSLDNAYVNFTHWAPVMGHDSDYAFTKEGFFANWIRHKAYFLGKCNFKAIDLVIPMAFPRRECDKIIIDVDSMAYIAISVKVKTSGSDLKCQTYLSTTEVEGIPSEQGVKPPSKSSNLRLTLHSLGFINPSSSVVNDESLVNHWVKPSADKPYIAFAMSMGNTDTAQFLIPEKPTKENAHRIVFGLRGFLETYQFAETRIKEILENILIRHDVSGRYPTSAPDYRQEEPVLRAARKPLDEPEDVLHRWFPPSPIDSSDFEMSDHQEMDDDDEEEGDGSNDASEAMDVALA